MTPTLPPRWSGQWDTRLLNLDRVRRSPFGPHHMLIMVVGGPTLIEAAEYLDLPSLGEHI